MFNTLVFAVMKVVQSTESLSVVPQLRKATFVFLMACLPVCGVAYAATSAASLSQQAHQLFIENKGNEARAMLRQAADVNPEDPSVVFERAMLDDAFGEHGKARAGYDQVQMGPLATAAAVPSAANLVALGRFTQARKAFAQLATSQDAYTAGYSQLWQLWLTARTQKGQAAALGAKLAKAAVHVKAATPQQRALAELYAGKGSVEAVFSAIDSMGLVDPLQRRDAYAEAAFFAGGYQQYVRRDYPAAMRLYQQELSHPGASIERPLLKQALARLPAASR
ncbi:hypothetical protein [Pseudomonas sp. JM0905a]|uniref:hypothetical protein n=1 Tax=Pseudomonas sp. JM0905a TaxID=2772484 RepID=UPI001687BAD5|nr:hypothetical protein [Pseudomonas sp. JM0905a]